MARLRGVHGGKGETADNPAQRGDPAFVDLFERIEGDAPEVEVSASFGVVLKAFGLSGREIGEIEMAGKG